MLKLPIFYKNPQGGAGALIVFMSVMTVMGLALFNWSDSFDKQSVINKQGSEADRFTATIFNNARKALSDSAGCGSIDNHMKGFRNFQLSSYDKEYTGNKVINCLVDSSIVRWIDTYNIKFETVLNKKDLLFKDVRVSVYVKTRKIKGLRSREFSRSKVYRVTILSLDKIGVTFFGNSSPRISSGGPIVEMTSTVLDSSPNDKKLSNIYYNDKDQKVRFLAPLLMRSKQLGAPPGDDMSVFRSIYTRGVYTNAFNSSTFNRFVPSNKSAWNFGVDYSYLARGFYPLPQTKRGRMTIGCDKTLPYNDARGIIKKVPDPTNYLTASKSCMDVMDPIHLLVINQAGGDLTINLSNEDRVFCGLVTVNKLRVNLSGSGEFGIFGLFNVGQLVVSGPSSASLRIHNPQDNIPETADLPGSSTQNLITDQMRSLASSIGKNYFLPMNRTSPLSPSSPDDGNFAKSCGGGMYEMQEEYPKLNDLPQYQALEKPSNGTLYMVKEVL